MDLKISLVRWSLDCSRPTYRNT